MLNKKMLNIFFIFVFVFGLFIYIKEKREVPTNYNEDIIKSLKVTKSQILPSLKLLFGEAIIEYGTKGVRNNLKHSMNYALVFSAPNDMKMKKKILRSKGWVEYTKKYQEQNTSTFCKNKYQLTLISENNRLYVEVLYDRLSPCWNFNKKLKSEAFSLVQ